MLKLVTALYAVTAFIITAIAVMTVGDFEQSPTIGYERLLDIPVAFIMASGIFEIITFLFTRKVKDLALAALSLSIFLTYLWLEIMFANYNSEPTGRALTHVLYQIHGYNNIFVVITLDWTAILLYILSYKRVISCVKNCSK